MNISDDFFCQFIEDIVVDQNTRYLDLNKYFFNEAVIPHKDLQMLAKKAKKIPLPIIYGRFIDNDHYLETLELLLASSHETKNRHLFFEKIMDPRIENKNSMLDIGPGTGEITLEVGKKFNHVTVIDVNDEPLSKLRSEDWGDCNLETIHRSILDIQTLGSSYNLIILSHVLYYLPKVYWFEIINKLYNALEPEGYLVVVLNDGLGKSKLVEHFGGSAPNLDELAYNLSKHTNFRVEKYASKEVYYALGVGPMMHISGIHLLDSGAVATSDELYKYYTTHGIKHNSIFELDIFQKFLVISK